MKIILKTKLVYFLKNFKYTFCVFKNINNN